MQDNNFKGEFSFIELTVILVRRKKIFFASLLFFIVVSAIFVSMKEPKYKYISLYEIPSSQEGSSLGLSGSTLKSQIELGMWPSVKREYEKESGGRLPFDLEITSSRSEDFVQLVSVASIENEAWVENIHDDVIRKLIDMTASRLAAYRGQLEAQIDSVTASLDRLEDLDPTAETLLTANNRLFELNEKLESISEGRVIAIAHKQENPVTISSVILASALIAFSVILSAALAFVFEFVVQVRRALGRESNESLT